MRSLPILIAAVLLCIAVNETVHWENKYKSCSEICLIVKFLFVVTGDICSGECTAANEIEKYVARLHIVWGRCCFGCCQRNKTHSIMGTISKANGNSCKHCQSMYRKKRFKTNQKVSEKCEFIESNYTWALIWEFQFLFGRCEMDLKPKIVDIINKFTPKLKKVWEIKCENRLGEF